VKPRLHILWDGDAAGLAEHQLSVAALGTPLQLLLQATRRIASNLIAGVDGEPERGVKGGRLAAGAADMDLRIVSINPGCLEMELELWFSEAATAAQPSLPELELAEPQSDLPERTLAELLAALADESKGRPRNAAVRKFLHSLQGITRQHYAASIGGRAIATVEFGEVGLLENESAPQPYLVDVRGVVSGASFAPQETEVRLTRPSGKTCRLSARPEDVELALSLRGRSVVARAMTDGAGHYTLVRLVDEHAHGQGLVDPDRAREQVLDRWRETLQRLSM
jgi:hypothetical protein